MCGITGYINHRTDKTILNRMTAALAHRGPNAAGYFHDAEPGIGLGHRRLSILDLSESANQPFFSADGRYAIVYNGEVYNFREIAERHSLPRRTTGDTEVIVEGFARIGERIFSEMNGMFALAIWDKAEKRLTLARDRIGIKPLFVAETAEGFFFGSEIKALLKARKFPVKRDSIPHFLHLGYLPGDESLFEGIRKFPAGHYGTVDADGLRCTAFWEAGAQVLPEACSYSDQEAKSILKELLLSSIRYRMISDVPLGTFLSGGTDSSLVTALAQSIAPHPVKTFTIGFKEAKFNESVHAAAVAKHLGTDHHEYMLSEQQALDEISHLLDIYDEPFSDSSAIPTLLVSQMARRQVTVALSGDGGDELFMGYGMYTWAERLHRPGVAPARKLIAALLRLGNNRMKRAAYLFDWSDRKRIKSHIFSQEQYYFTEGELASLLAPDVPRTLHFSEDLHPGRPLNARERQSLYDLTNYLKDQLLVKVDRASMHHSLEVRVPLLDHRIVEFALNLPDHLKIRNGVTKYLLKEVLYDFVPARLFDRPKWGFGIPLHTWLRGELKYLVDDYLSAATVERCGLVRPEAAENLKKRFFAGEDYLYNRIWALVLLHKWYVRTID